MYEEKLCENLVEELKTKWEYVETNYADVFRYKLNVNREKVLEGNFQFYVQVSKNL